jgi:hypothetical protein
VLRNLSLVLPLVLFVSCANVGKNLEKRKVASSGEYVGPATCERGGGEVRSSRSELFGGRFCAGGNYADHLIPDRDDVAAKVAEAVDYDFGKSFPSGRARHSPACSQAFVYETIAHCCWVEGKVKSCHLFENELPIVSNGSGKWSELEAPRQDGTRR